MSDSPRGRLGDLASLLHFVCTVQSPPTDADGRRQALADVCRGIAVELGTLQPKPQTDPELPRRLRETLECLLLGDSEKQVAAKLGLSPHTVHIHVKRLYRHFDVSSRGELLAKCLRRSA